MLNFHVKKKEKKNLQEKKNYVYRHYRVKVTYVYHSNDRNDGYRYQSRNHETVFNTRD